MPNHDYFKPAFFALATDGCIGDLNGEPAYAYIRVSDEVQAEEGRTGLPRQLEHIHQIAREKGYKIAWELVFADDATGFEFEDRPHLTRLRREYKSSHRRANVVVMEHLDRLSRNADWHQGFLLDEMKKQGILPVFWKEFTSRVERAVMGAIAQDGMEQAKERMREGRLMKAKSGRVTATRPAHGYKLVDSHGREGEAARKDTHYGIEDFTATSIRYIFTRIGLEAATASAVAGELNDHPTLYPPPKNMKCWTQSYVSGIVKNSVYKGEFIANRWKVVKGKHIDEFGREVRSHRNVFKPKEEWVIVPVPPIVAPDLWDLANEVMEKNRQMASRNARAPFLLTGLVKCAYCGKSYIGAQDNRHHKGKTYVLRSYRCLIHGGGKNRSYAGQTCQNRRIPTHVLDDAVWFSIQKYLLDPETISSVLEPTELLEQNRRLQEQIDYLSRTLDEREAEDQKLYRAYLADAFDEEEYASRHRGIREAKETLWAERERLEAQIISQNEIEARKQFVLSVVEEARQNNLVQNAPFEVKQRIIKMLVDKITLDVVNGEFLMEGTIRGVFSTDIVNTFAGRCGLAPMGRG